MKLQTTTTTEQLGEHLGSVVSFFDTGGSKRMGILNVLTIGSESNNLPGKVSGWLSEGNGYERGFVAYFFDTVTVFGN